MNDILDRSPSKTQGEVHDLERRRNDRHLNDLEFVMGSPSGRRFIWRWMQGSSLFTDPFTGNSQTYHNCGKQSAVRDILTVLYTSRFTSLRRTMEDEAMQDDLVTEIKLGDK